MKIINALLVTIIIMCSLITAYNMGYNMSLADNEPVSDLFWIDNYRVHIDSIIDCSPIYDDTFEIIGSWIRVSYGETVIHIECLTTDEWLWWEFKESWLMAFNDGIKERI
jgi:hypothetical protein